jgi:glycosyltransferase involved in cell wall biosynthesis
MDRHTSTYNPLSCEPRVTAIIPTLCESIRSVALLRAINSIQHASAFPIRILVVVNGNRFDRELLGALIRRADIKVLQTAEGSLPLAHLIGRNAVSTAYFAFLDDDDEFLPGAIDLRVSMLDDHPDADLAVTNGYIRRNGKDEVLYSRMRFVSHDPLRELFEENWLHNCNSLFRSVSVPPAYFESSHKYMEWTWLGYRLSLDGKRVVATEDLSFRYNDTPSSLSKSALFLESRVQVYERMLGTNPPSDIVPVIKKRLSSAWHAISNCQLKNGMRADAIYSHVRSLMSDPSGVRYIGYTRHVLNPFRSFG